MATEGCGHEPIEYDGTPPTTSVKPVSGNSWKNNGQTVRGHSGDVNRACSYQNRMIYNIQTHNRSLNRRPVYPTDTFPRLGLSSIFFLDIMQHFLAITAHLAKISVLVSFRFGNDCSFREMQVISEPLPRNNLLGTQAWLAVSQW